MRRHRLWSFGGRFIAVSRVTSRSVSEGRMSDQGCDTEHGLDIREGETLSFPFRRASRSTWPPPRFLNVARD